MDETLVERLEGKRSGIPERRRVKARIGGYGW